MKSFNQRRRQSINQQYPHRTRQWMCIGELVLIVLSVLAGLVGQDKWSFGFLTLAFFLAADGITVVFVRHRWPFIVATLTALALATLGYGILTLSWGLLFHW